MKNILQKANEYACQKNKDIQVFEVYRNGDLFAYVIMNIYDCLDDTTCLRFITLEYFNIVRSKRSLKDTYTQTDVPVYLLNCWVCNCKEHNFQHAGVIKCQHCGAVNTNTANVNTKKFIQILNNIEKKKRKEIFINED